MRISRIAFAAACALLLAPSVAAARDCKPAYTAMGPMSGPNQSDAERTAEARWRVEVRHIIGREYSDWDKAANKKMECEQLNSDTWQCWATAKPCSN